PAPKPAATPVPVDPRHAVLNSFQGPIIPVESTPMYSLGVFLAACVMLLLVVAYIGIIGLVAYLTYVHAVDNVTLLSDLTKGPRNDGKSLWLIVYALPLVAGIVVVLFLIKPLFAKSVVRDKP